MSSYAGDEDLFFNADNKIGNYQSFTFTVSIFMI